MKQLLTILIPIILLFSCNSEKSDLDGCWYNTWNDMNWLSHGLTEFNNGTLRYVLIEYDTLFEKNYNLQNSVVKMDTSEVKIEYLTKDSLITIENDTTKSTLIRLQKTNFTEKDKQRFETELKTNNWEIQVGDVQLVFYLDTLHERYKEPFFPFQHKSLRTHSCLEVAFDEESSYITSIRSNLKLYNGYLFLVASIDGHYPSFFFQVTDFQKNEIKGKQLGYFNDKFINTSFKKVNNLTKSEKAKLKKRLSKKWTKRQLIEPTIEFLKDSITIRNSYVNLDTFYPTRREFLENDYQIEFSKSGYSISVGDKIIRQGTHWDITPNGRYIYLDNKSDEDNFIKIKFIENQLKMERGYAVRMSENYIYSDYFEMILE